jgi:DNA-3-methyladenine glycosylase
MSRFRNLPRAFFQRPPEVVARELLGRYLNRRTSGESMVVRLVETEAYLGAEDRASHAWGGRRTRRTASLFRDGGFAYVYLVYGMWNCLNVVCGSRDDGGAVLLRAAEPVSGLDRMACNRGLEGSLAPGALAGGPGKLCQALEVDRSLDGVPLWRGRLCLAEGDPAPADAVVAGPRIGVDYAGEAAAWPLRFALRGNAHVSRPRLA